MTTYQTALYVNVLDGQSGTVKFVSDTTGAVYTPIGDTVNPVVTADFFNSPALLEIVEWAPSGSSATWQGGVGGPDIDTYSADHRVLIQFNGTLPEMSTGVQPCGWLLQERGPQVYCDDPENVGSSLVLSFPDVGDAHSPIPYNQYPLAFVPYFGNYTTSNSALTITPDGPTKSGDDGWTNAVVTVALPKPLNPHQSFNVNPASSVLQWEVTSTAGGGLVAIPSDVLLAVTCSATTNGYGQVTALVFTVPFSSETFSTVPPATDYAFHVAITQDLDYLKGSDYVLAEEISVAVGSCTISTPEDTSGPDITSAVWSLDTGGHHYVSAYTGYDTYCGPCKVVFAASDPWGIQTASSPALTRPLVGCSPYGTIYPTVTGASSPWTASFDVDVSLVDGSGNPAPLTPTIVLHGLADGHQQDSAHDALPSGNSDGVIQLASIKNFNQFQSQAGFLNASNGVITPSGGIYHDVRWVCWKLPIPSPLLTTVWIGIYDSDSSVLYSQTVDVPELTHGDWTVQTVVGLNIEFENVGDLFTNVFAEIGVFSGLSAHIGDATPLYIAFAPSDLAHEASQSAMWPFYIHNLVGAP